MNRTVNGFAIGALFIALVSMIALAGCESGGDDGGETAVVEQPQEELMTTSSGLKYKDVVVGTGAEAASGDQVQVHYTGWLLVDGEKGNKFDSSVDRGQPLPFTVGIGQVIKGWDEGITGMKVGGKRELVIPPELGYGDRGTPGGPIPPNATLIFDVELMDVQKSEG